MEVIEVSESEKKSLVAYYDNQILELEKKLSTSKSLRDKLLQGNDTDNKKVKNFVVSNQDELEVKINSSTTKDIPSYNWRLIALGALTSLDEISTTNEIYDAAAITKPDILSYNKPKVIAKLSGGLTNLVKRNKVNKVNNALGKGNFWLLSSWYDGGKIIDAYKQELIKKYGVDENELFEAV